MTLNFGIQPFWFWNGKMREEEIARQIREMAGQGIKGFFIHPRQGLTVPYLSEEWFRKVGIAVEEAKKYKLEVWLYDEYPYPSGASGGQVLLDHPEFEAKSLKRLVMEQNGPRSIETDLPWGQTVLAKAYPVKDSGTEKEDRIEWENPVDLASYIGTGYRENIFQMSGLTQYNRKRFFTGSPVKKLYWQAPEGRWHIEIMMQTAVEHFKYFGKYIDPLNPDAIAYFIKTTHEKYREHLGQEFGKTIKGTFTDEITAFPGSLPWSPTLPEQFQRRSGYSLKDKLPALFGRMGENTDKIRYDYWNTVTDRFFQSYEIQVHDWCHNNNLLYVGEKPILRSRQLKYFDVPGIDAGHQKIGSIPLIAASNYRANGKMAGSAAHFYNKSGALCECFHSIGWGMTLQDMKWIFDWLALQGIRWFVPHAFFYTTDGLTKHDAPPSSFYQNPHWRHTRLLSEYAGKIMEGMSGGRRKVKILLVDPVTSQWTAMGEKRDVNKRLKEDFSSLQKMLLQNHLDYYIIDPELLGQCQIVDRCIQVNGERFELLILPPMLNMEDFAFHKVKEYIEKGGNIIGTLCLPVEQIGDISGFGSEFSRWFHIDAGKAYREYLQGVEQPSTDSVLSDISDSNGKKGCFFAGNLEMVPEIVESLLTRDISVEKNGDGEQDGDILAAVYEKENKTTCFLINTSGTEHPVRITLNVGKMQSPGLATLPLGPEGNESIRYERQGERIAFPLEFCPYQSYLLTVEDRKEVKVPPVRPVARKNLDIRGNWNFSIDRMNTLRLGTWNLQAEGTSKEQSVECQPIINQISDAAIPLPVKLKDYFGCPKEMEFPPLKCRYRTTFQLEEDAADIPVFVLVLAAKSETKSKYKSFSITGLDEYNSPV